jgi:oligopeptide/dipeptide ABC transporter ATP-binding protein
MKPPLLAIDGIRVAFHGQRGRREVLSGVSFDIGAGEIVGVVGESGSGKSVTALAVMRLLGAQGEITAGSIRFDSTDLTTLGEAGMRDMRGRRMAMIFQEPMTSLNPLLTIGFQIAEVLREKLHLSRAETRARVAALLARVGIPNPAGHYDEYPNTLSGGMRQRVMIAMALACAPRLLLADEPTTALDVTIQAQILDLMETLRDEDGAAIMLITHDMGVIARMAERVVVMYAGEVVEASPIRPLFERPAHPYTRLLMAATPTVRHKVAALPSIPGTMPTPEDVSVGCRFQPRCPIAIEPCRTRHPPLRTVEPGRSARCHRAEDMLTGAMS